jgi:hypothetical protein
VRVACSGDSSGGLNIVAIGTDNQLWHTARRSNGTWFPDFTLVSGHSGGLPPSSPVGVGVGNDTNDDMQIVVITAAAQLLHTIRHDNGDWQPGFVVVPTVGGPATFAAITTGSGAIPGSPPPTYSNPALVTMSRTPGAIAPWSGTLPVSFVPANAEVVGLTWKENAGVSASNGALLHETYTTEPVWVGTATHGFDGQPAAGTWMLTGVTGTGLTDNAFFLEIQWQ